MRLPLMLLFALPIAAAADFRLPAIEHGGKRRFLRLSDRRGKKTVVVHFASW